MVEQLAFNQTVEGSIPSDPTMADKKTIKEIIRFLFEASEKLVNLSEDFGDTKMGKAALERAYHYVDAAEMIAEKYGLEKRKKHVE